MNFEFSNKVIELQNKLTNFMNENVYKNEEVFEDQSCIPCPIYCCCTPLGAQSTKTLKILTDCWAKESHF